MQLTRRGQLVWQGAEPKRTAAGVVDRSASLVKIARVLSDAGASVEAIVAALAERDTALGWRKYSDREDALDQYRRIVDLVTRELQ